MLTRDEMLRAEDLQAELVKVPEWGGEVKVRGLTATERDVFDQSIVSEDERDLTNIRARLTILCVVDDDGGRVFTNEDAALLGEKSGAAVDRLFEAAQRLSGMRNRDIEELAKNSAGGPSDDSPSD